MGLTRLRAEQISDIDYKQAVRVITVTNITLSGGAPNQVDGVNLVIGDRVLVNGQNTGSQNGIYEVQTVGTGSNGTWIRSTDTNATGELQAGTIVMVTEGTVYKDTQWKLTTNNPIVIGTTALTFEQNSAFAFGNVYANGTAVLANTVGDVLTLTAGNNIQITGNNTAKSVTIAVTGVSTANISNGTSNVTVVSSGGNVTVGVGGTANVAEFSTGGLKITGFASATGNVTGGNILTAGLISATSTITSAANVVGGNISTAGLITATGNIQGGNIRTAGLITATGAITGAAISGTSLTVTTGNITAGNLLLSGAIIDSAQLDIQTSAANANIALAPNGTGVVTVSTQVSAVGNVTGGNIRTAGLITATGNIQGGNLLTAGITSSTGNVIGGNILTSGLISATANITGGNITTAGLISATSTITSAANITGGNITTAGLITATGNITSGNISTAGLITATGNITAGNVRTAGLITATGNITGGNLSIVGDATISGNLSVTGNATLSGNILGDRIINGNTSIEIQTASGNANVSVGGTSNVAVFTTAGLVANSVAATNNGAGTNFKVGDDTWLGDINLADTLSIRGQQNAANAYIVFGNADGTQLGRAGSGPLTYGGAFSAAGNVTGGNILTVGQISATGNVTGNFFIGNGAFLTGLSAGTSNGISNGATSISIPVASGNIAMSVAGQSNTVVINLGSLTMYGTFAGPKTLNANVAVANAVNAVIFGPVIVNDGYNITVPDASTLYTYSGT